MKALTAYQGRSLRVMQVHTLYVQYTKGLYARNPFLDKTPFSMQMQTFVRDAYSAIHMLSPYMVDCETLLVMSNCVQMQRAWLSEHNLAWPQSDNWQKDIVRLQIEHFKPDVLYFTDPISFDASFLDTLSFTPPCILGWRAADIPSQTDWSGFDAILSGLPKLLALAKTLGAYDGIMFHPGMPTWIKHEISNTPHEVDVVFVGSLNAGQHVRRFELLQEIAKSATKYGFSLEMYLLCPTDIITSEMRPYVNPAVFGIDMHRILRRGRIVVDDRAWHGMILPDGTKVLDLGGEDTSNMRIFEGTGGGSMVLTEYLKGISRYFEMDKEIVTYENHAEAVEKILYYLKHEDERAAIAKAGQERCLKDWNMQVATSKFLEIVQNILQKKQCI